MQAVRFRWLEVGGKRWGDGEMGMWGCGDVGKAFYTFHRLHYLNLYGGSVLTGNWCFATSKTEGVKHSMVLVWWLSQSGEVVSN